MFNSSLGGEFHNSIFFFKNPIVLSPYLFICMFFSFFLFFFMSHMSEFDVLLASRRSF